MNVLIVTGLSGAGKTRALQILEDMGYYCMDNISPKILLQLIHGEMQEEGFSKRLAVTWISAATACRTDSTRSWMR